MREEDTSEPRSASVRRRQAELLVLLRRDGRLDVGPTAARLGVTQETLRRDLRAMEGAGLVRRSYGTAYPVESGTFEQPYESLASHDLEEKNRIADAAADLVGTAQTIYLDDGHLASLIATRLTSIRTLTVITAALPTALAAADLPGIEVLVTGGRLRSTSMSTVEHGHEALLDRVHIDVAFLSASGISIRHGLTTADPTLATVKAAAIRAARRRVYVGTHTTFGVTGFVRFGKVRDLEAIVTGGEFPAHRTARYSQEGPRVIRA